MRVQRSVRAVAPREFVQIGPEIGEQMSLEGEPSAATVASYILTRGASRAWEAINNQLTGAYGALFWIGGAAGAGKTHFLNYVSALSSRAGSVGSETGRYFTLPIEVANGASAGEIEHCVLESIDKALSGNDGAPALWCQMRGAEALAIALDGARRQGVNGISITLDLGFGKTAPALEILSALAEVARSFKRLRLIVVAAGRGEAPAIARVFDVTPAADEVMDVAVGRARVLEDATRRSVEGLYRNLENSFEARALYPLHPTAVRSLHALYPADVTVAVLARAVREAIEVWHDERNFQRLIGPADLMRSGAVRRAVDVRLGAAGRAALRIAKGAAAAIATEDAARATIEALVDTLVLFHLSDPAADLSLNQLRARMEAAAIDGDAGDRLANYLTALAARTNGVIAYEAQAQTARFNPHGAGAAEVAAFNLALALLRRFDSSLTAIQEKPELNAGLKRLQRALGTALEGACRNRDTLAAALGENNAHLAPAQQQVFAGFIEVVESGATAMIELCGDHSRRETALAMVAAYEALAAVAESIPRLRSMREYLAATRLQSGDSAEANPDHDTGRLETQCKLLAIELEPAALMGTGRNLDALEARFQKFKWTYVQLYREAHEHFRLELERLAPIATDARLHLEALRRLNAIAALGVAAGAELAAEMLALEPRLAPCDFGGALAPEVTPCCPCCGYPLGALSPRSELNDLGERARRALQAKLATLAQSAISRLIHQSDSSHRLEGFLKIVQAAQTDALVRVLDDQLARYLASLLDESRAAADLYGRVADAVESPKTLRASRSRGTKLDRRNGHNHRALKLPPDVNRI